MIAGGLACLLRARLAPHERRAWIAIGAAVLSWGAAEVYWTAVILHDPAPPYPSPADVGYLAFYPLPPQGRRPQGGDQALAYPLGDVLLLALVVGVSPSPRWRPGRTWWLLLGGLSALVVAPARRTRWHSSSST